MERLKKIIEENYRSVLIAMLYRLAEENIGEKEIKMNTSVGSITIKLKG